MHSLDRLDDRRGRGRHDPGAGHATGRRRAARRARRQASSRSSATSPSTVARAAVRRARRRTIDVIHTAGVIHPRRDRRVRRGQRRRHRRRCSSSPREHGARRFVHVSSNSPFGTNSHPGRPLPQRRAVPPVLRLRAVEDGRPSCAVFDAVETRARRRDRAPPVVLRPAPAAAPDDVLQARAHRPVPGDRRRRPDALDGVRRQPRRRRRCAPSSSPRLPGAGGGSPTPARTTCREIVDTVGRALARRGLRRRAQPRPGCRDRRGASAEIADALVQRTRPLPPAAARARRDGQDDRLRHLGRPRRARLRARGRARRGHAPQHPLVHRARARAVTRQHSSPAAAGTSGRCWSAPGAAGDRVRVLDISDADDRPAEVEFVLGDIRDRTPWRRAVDGCDVVYHNVAQVPLAKDADLLRTVNVDGTRAAAARPPPRPASPRSCTRRRAPCSACPTANPVLPTTVPKPAGGLRTRQARRRVGLPRRRAATGSTSRSCARGPSSATGGSGIFGILFDWIADGADPFVLGDGSEPLPVRARRRPGRRLHRRRRRRRARRSSTSAPTGSARCARRSTHLCAHAGTGATVRRLPAGTRLAGDAGQRRARRHAVRAVPLVDVLEVDVVRHRARPHRSSAGSRRGRPTRCSRQSYDWFVEPSVERDARREPASPQRPPGRARDCSSTRRGRCHAPREHRERSSQQPMVAPDVVRRAGVRAVAAVRAGRGGGGRRRAAGRRQPRRRTRRCRSPTRTSSTARSPAPPVPCGRCSTCSRRGTACGTWTSSATATHASCRRTSRTTSTRRAPAFFPLFPMLGRAFDCVLPGGDSFAVLVMNTIFGFVAVVLIGMLGARLYGERVGRTTTTLVALFPGSFVLTFAYSESLMLMLAAAAMLCLLDRRWLLAGVFAALDHGHPTQRCGDRAQLRRRRVHRDPRRPRLAGVVVGAVGADRLHRVPDLARPAHRRGRVRGSGSSARRGARAPASGGRRSRTRPRRSPNRSTSPTDTITAVSVVATHRAAVDGMEGAHAAVG